MRVRGLSLVFQNFLLDALRALLDPEVVWHQPGRSVLAGDHRGIDAVLGFLATTMELTAGSFPAEPHDVIAGDQHVVGLHLAQAERQSHTLADRQVLVAYVRDGKIAEVWEHVGDQYAFDEFFSQ